MIVDSTSVTKTKQYVAEPQAGRIFLDRTGSDDYCLTCTVSYQQEHVYGNLCLDFADDGDGVVIGLDRAGENVTYMVEDLLPRQVYTSDGEVFHA